MGWSGGRTVLGCITWVGILAGQDLASGSGLAVVFVGQTQAGLDLFPLFVFSPTVLAGSFVVLAS